MPEEFVGQWPAGRISGRAPQVLLRLALLGQLPFRRDERDRVYFYRPALLELAKKPARPRRKPVGV
jgi:hypothetical protein